MFKIIFSTLFLFGAINNSTFAEISRKYNHKKIEINSYPLTTIKGDLFFTIGALQSPDKNEALHFTYENKFKSVTSFKGTDKLKMTVESGNASSSPLNLDLQSKKGDNLKISTLLYEFPINEEIDFLIGPKMFGYNGLAGKSTSYSERIAILDGSNFTTAAGIGPGIGISTNKNNGLNASLKIASNSQTINNESTHFITQFGLTKKYFGGTITSNLNDKYKAYGVAAYFIPKNFPSISLSIEQKQGSKIKTTENWIFALQKKLNSKKFGIAVGTYNEEKNICYEGWSEIKLTDNKKIIPVVFHRQISNDFADLGFALNMKLSY